MSEVTVTVSGPVRDEEGGEMKGGYRKRRPEWHRPKTVHVTVEQGESGFWFAKSHDMRGLLVAEPSREATIASIPKAIADLYLAADGVDSVDVYEVGPLAWVVRPVSRTPFP
jgi:hypothetical protein